MIIKDRIYGDLDIKSGVILDLINSQPLKRLRKISQDGAPHFIQPVRDVNRFEHSVGVWYLSKKFKVPLEEQIASLLHDVPHTAFSHVADFIYINEKHDFHEKFTNEVIARSEIPKILNKNGISSSKVFSNDHFPLLENNLPDISLDRLDYFLRDGFTVGFLPKAVINLLLSEIHVKNDLFYFNDKQVAAMFTILFVSFSRLIWLDPTAHAAFFLMAGAIKEAINLRVLKEEDLFTDDETVLRILRKANSSKINNYLNSLVPGNEFEYVPKDEAEFFGLNKPRWIDPWVKTGTEMQRVSKLVPSISYYFEEFNSRYKYIGVRRR
jgi:HD superfamily phosphohydrolase